MALAIDLATPDATETECSVVDALDNQTALSLRLSRRGKPTARLECGLAGFTFSFDCDADAAEALGNSMLLCAAQMREQA